MNIIVAIIFIVIGLLSIFLPEIAWYITRGWQYKDVELSDFAIKMTRVCGVIAVILGIVIILT